MSVRAILGRVLLVSLFFWCVGLRPAQAADHRDAPTIDDKPEGDLTDVFAFVDLNDSSRLVLAMGVNSFAVPAAPGTYSFSPHYLYQFKIDNDGDGIEDFVFQVKFRNTATGQTVQMFGPLRPEQVGSRNLLHLGRPHIS